MAKLLCPQGPFSFSQCRLHERVIRNHGVRWNSRELMRYAIQVYYFFRQGELRAEPEGNKWQFYRMLSMFVQSKNPNQCRIFHKKVIENYRNLQNLFQYLLMIYEDFQEMARKEEANISQMLMTLRRERLARKSQRDQDIDHGITQEVNLTGQVLSYCSQKQHSVKQELITDIKYFQYSEQNSKAHNSNHYLFGNRQAQRSALYLASE